MWTLFLLAVLGAPTAHLSRGETLEAVEVAARAGTPEAVAALRAHLAHPLQSVRGKALTALARLGDPIAGATAVEWLAHPDVQTRLDALAALSEPRVELDETAATALRRQLADARVEVRLATLRTLKARSAPVPAPLLATLDDDESAAVRTATLDLIAEGAGPAARQLAVGRLADLDVGVRFAAIAALGRLKDATVRPALEHLLGGSDPALVTAAIAALGALGDVAAVDKVAPLALFAGAGQVTRQALAALGQLPSPAGAGVLVLRLRRFGTADAALTPTLEALRQQGTEAEPALVELVDERPEDRLLAVVLTVLGEVGSQASVLPVARIVPRTTSTVVPALSCLARIAERGADLQTAWPLLAAALNDPSQTVRAAGHALRPHLDRGRRNARRAPASP